MGTLPQHAFGRGGLDMRFLVDECTGPAVARWLRRLHHDVFSVYDEARGLDDESIIEKVGVQN